MERILLEVAGTGVLGGAAYGLSSYFSISPLDKRYGYFCVDF
jgi:hypothetical protein